MELEKRLEVHNLLIEKHEEVFNSIVKELAKYNIKDKGFGFNLDVHGVRDIIDKAAWDYLQTRLLRPLPKIIVEEKKNNMRSDNEFPYQFKTEEQQEISKDKVFFELDDFGRLVKMTKEYRNQVYDRYREIEFKDLNKSEAVIMIVEYLLSTTPSFEISVLEKIVDLLSSLGKGE